MLPLNRAPSWVYPKARFDLDFRNRRYWGGYIDEKTSSEDKGSLLGDGGGVSAGVAYTPQRNGILKVGAGTSQNRITDMGLYTERGLTNSALWSRDMTNAVWVISNTTDITAAKDQPTADNLATANGCSSLLCNVNNGTILQSATVVSGNVIYSAYIKRLTGSGVISMTCDGGASWIDKTSAISSTGYSLVQIPVQTVTNPQFGFKMGTAGDKIAVDFNQCETGTKVLASSLANTPAPCLAGTVVTRANQTAYFTASAGLSTGNNGQSIVRDVFSTGGPFALLLSWTGDVTTSANTGPGMILTDLTSPGAWQGGIGGGLGTTNRTTNQGTNGYGNWNKSCGRTRGDGTRFCLNGGDLSANNTGAQNLPNANTGGTHFNLGNNGSGTADNPLNGSIGRATFWDTEITDGQMMEYTTLVNAYDPYP